MILVVDDNTDVTDLVTAALNKENISSIAVNSAIEAHKILEERDDIKLVLLDLLMPEMDGNELIEKMQTRGRSTPIIVMSGYINHLKEDLRTIPKHVFEKPFGMSEIVNEVKKWV